MKKKAFVFDLDGTLLNSNKEIFPENINMINRIIDQGDEVCIITGRNLSQVTQYLDLLNKVRYFIVINGGAIYDNDLKEIKFLTEPLDKEIVNDVLEYAQKTKREIQFSNYERLYRVYFGKNIFEDITEKDFFKDSTKNPVFDKWEDVKHLISGPILRVAIRCERELRMPFYEYLYNKYATKKICNVTESSNTYVECDHFGINKFNALKIVSEKWNIDLNDIYGFGDSDNDLSFLCELNHSIAMGNAKKEIKDKCKEVIGDNNSLAIAQYLEKFII